MVEVVNSHVDIPRVDEEQEQAGWTCGCRGRSGREVYWYRGRMIPGGRGRKTAHVEGGAKEQNGERDEEMKQGFRGRVSQLGC